MLDVVVNAPNDGSCSNGLFCDGSETCDAVLDCQAGTPPATDDGVSCTVDLCDEASEMVFNVPFATACNDGDRCTANGCDAVTGCFNTPIPGCVVPPVPALPGAGRALLMAMLALSARALLRCHRPR